MDRRFALVALALIAPLYAWIAWLTWALTPLLGWALGLVTYWAILGAALLRWADRDTLIELALPRPPGRLIAVCLALPVLVLGATTLRLLGQEPLPAHLLLAAAIAAATNATLEELFWRGALIPRATPGAAALALGLFTLAHLVWLGAWGLDTGAPPWAALAGALALGGVWTAARLASGSLGAAILSHAGVNLFAFSAVIARNLPT